MSLDDVDIPRLQGAIKKVDQLADLAAPIVQSFDDYASRITNPAKKQFLEKETARLDATLLEMAKYGMVCAMAHGFLEEMNKPGRTTKRVSEEQKKWILEETMKVRSSLCEAMRIVVRAAPKRSKLRGRAENVLARVAAQPLLGSN